MKAVTWNGLDGLINDRPFMPGASSAQKARMLMDLAKADGVEALFAAAAVQRVKADIEKLTGRSMKQSVAAYIQEISCRPRRRIYHESLRSFQNARIFVTFSLLCPDIATSLVMI